MKKVLLAVAAILVMGAPALAFVAEEYNRVALSSYTDAQTFQGGPVMFSSAPITFEAINVASAVPNSYITIWRSTTPTFTNDLATQTVINTGPVTPGAFMQPVPLYNITNTSYTFIQKVGQAQVTIFYRRGPAKTDSGQSTFPGLRGVGNSR